MSFTFNNTQYVTARKRLLTVKIENIVEIMKKYFKSDKDQHKESSNSYKKTD